ncbi:heavy metal sensor histidine kinase [Rhizobacter sp. J219]|uniref:heavy metal sensor histidine kinase n=1 Tax=Rhizobacter sp. J219 TaxID=2898430 RepID=UPI002150F1C2|nr:heavy metal sensor histidine kinase [Rhizobacter sp. J219]MCR5882185.1 heavy metal sensor histidine kinase [Rhizobacter sp. J219]
MKSAAPGSLARRLSVGLALLSLTVLAMVCSAVFGWAYLGLSEQQVERLERPRVQLEHLFKEARESGDERLLTHKLGDVLVGQTLLSVEILRSDGSLFFRWSGNSLGEAQRLLRFALPAPDASGNLWQTRLALDVSADAATLSLLAASLAAAAAVGALLIAAGGSVLVRRGLQPVRRLVDQTRALSVETRDRRLDGSAQPDELAPLVLQFNQLLGRLQYAFDRLEAFNADVAHELATPLSTLIGSTEIALRRDRSTEELRVVLECNLEELQRLARIVQDMLFLAHADHGTQARRQPVASLAELLWRVASFHEAALADHSLTVQVQGDAAADIDSSLIERAASNLLSNAARYARAGSIVNLVVEVHEDEVHLQVENEGETIPADRVSRVFDRFYRAETSRKNADRHHGLGLSIVAAIAQMHGGSPFARSSQGRTTVGFTLRRTASSEAASAPSPTEPSESHKTKEVTP